VSVETFGSIIAVVAQPPSLWPFRLRDVLCVPSPVSPYPLGEFWVFRSRAMSRSPGHPISRGPTRLFRRFCCKQRHLRKSTLAPRLGGPCVALGWPKGGPGATQTQTQSQAGRGSQSRFRFWLRASCQLLAARFSKIFASTPLGAAGV
jgi:hypothetical protein